MITLVAASISGYGVLFFGGLLEGRVAYEIVVSEQTGAPRILWPFQRKNKSPHAPRYSDHAAREWPAHKATDTRQPRSIPFRFDVVDDKSIAICRDLM